MQRVVALQKGIFVCPDRAAAIARLAPDCLFRWARDATTSYGYRLSVIPHGGHRYINEIDVRVIAKIQQDFPVRRGGPGSKRRQAEMKEFAERLRASLTPTP